MKDLYYCTNRSFPLSTSSSLHISSPPFSLNTSVRALGASALDAVLDDRACLLIDECVIVAPLAVQLAAAIELLANVDTTATFATLGRAISEAQRKELKEFD